MFFFLRKGGFYQLTREAKSCKSRKCPSRIAEGGIVILKKRYLSTCKPAKGQSLPKSNETISKYSNRRDTEEQGSSPPTKKNERKEEKKEAKAMKNPAESESTTHTQYSL
jgi:hypothetical protein